MSTTLGTRFSALPKMQEERRRELSEQAQQAAQYTMRLSQTKEQAERIMMEEMDRTHRMEQEFIESFGPYQEWRRALRDVELRAKERSNKQVIEQSRLRNEMERLGTLMQDKRRQVGGMEEERQRALRDTTRWEQERASLFQQVDEAQRGENEARDRISYIHNQIRATEEQIRDARERLASVKQRQNDIGPEIAKLNDEISKRTSQLEVFKATNESILGESEEWNQKRDKAQTDCGRAQTLAKEAREAVDEHRGIYKVLREGLDMKLQKYDQTRATLQKAQAIKAQSATLIGSTRQKLDKLDEDCQVLEKRRDDMQRQIDELVKQRDVIDQEWAGKNNERSTVSNEIMCLDRDEDLADRYYQDAKDLMQRGEEEVGAARQAFENEENLINSFTRKREEAEHEVNDAKKIIDGCDEHVNRIVPRLNDYRSRLDSIQSQVAAERTKINELLGERDGLDRDINNYTGWMDKLTGQLEQLQGEYQAASRTLVNCLDSGSAVKRRLEEIEKVLSHTGDLSFRLSEAHGEIRTLENRYHQCESNGRELEGRGNPFNEEVRSLEEKRDAVLAEARRALQTSPPRELREQMAREAEGVMRAELASGFVARQHQIEEEAKFLASLRASEQPRIVLDEQAAGRLVGEHLGGASPDYRRVASAVVELTEQHHIASH